MSQSINQVIPIGNEVAARREVVSNRSVQIVHEDCEQAKQRRRSFIADGYIDYYMFQAYCLLIFVSHAFWSNPAMTILYWVSGIVTTLLLIYLLIVLIKPELFS